MARDFENLDNIDDLDDHELRQLVQERLAEHRGLDADDVTVSVLEGTVVLEGRVGTVGECEIADHILSDVVGAGLNRNNLVVDPIRRAVSPEAIDDHLVDEEEHEGLLLGDREVPMTAESEHLAKDRDDELFGTAEVQKSIEDAAPWIPPERPTQEGVGEEGDLREDAS
jgi:BON domain-containing protein